MKELTVERVISQIEPVDVYTPRYIHNMNSYCRNARTLISNNSLISKGNY